MSSTMALWDMVPAPDLSGYNRPTCSVAAMREALATLRKRFDNNTMAYQDRYFKFSGWHWHKKAKEAARWRDVFHELREVCDAALATPPRNCDVGTFEEQRKRFKVFCRDRQYGLCDGCPVVRSGFCTLQWAQMPYGEGGAQ